MQEKTSILIVFLILGFVCSASALTADVENPRMVLRLSPGDSSEQYFNLKNTNGLPVTVDILVTGDLASTTILKDNSFTLLPEREKKVYFVISPKISGTSETKLNIRYSTSSGDGAGIAAVVIVIAKNNSTLENNENVTKPSFNFRDLIPKVNIKFTPLSIMYISNAILLLILIVILIHLLRISRKVNKLQRRTNNNA